MTDKRRKTKPSSGGGRRPPKGKATLKDLPAGNSRAAAIKAGRDLASGMATGKRQWGPVVITKEI